MYKRQDPFEDNNVYDNPEYASVIAELKDALRARRAELGEDDEAYGCNQIIEDFWEYGDEAREQARQISHGYLELMTKK